LGLGSGKDTLFLPVVWAKEMYDGMPNGESENLRRCQAPGIKGYASSASVLKKKKDHHRERKKNPSKGQ